MDIEVRKHPAYDVLQTHADHLEQAECMRCDTTFTPTTHGQYLCPACSEEQEDYYNRREDAGFPVGAVGSC